MSLAPRFGSPADFSLLFADDSSNRTDYVLGTILVGAVLFGFFLLWMLLLGLFTCLGTQRVGFLAGSPMAPREMGDEGVSMEVEPPKNEDSENGNNPKPYRGTRVGVVRFIFLLSCISVITVSVLSIYVRGFNDLKDSSDDAKSIVEMFHQNATTGEIMVRDMIRESNDFQGKRDIIVDELDSDSFCPDPNLDTLTGQPINVLREELIQTLSSLNDFEQKNLDKLQKLGFDKVRLNTDALSYDMISKNSFTQNIIFLLCSQLRSQSQTIKTFLNIVGVQRWEMLAFMCTFCAISSFMMLGTILSWSGRPIHALKCFNTWVLLPIFLVLVTAAWTTLSLSAVFSVMNAGMWISIMRK